MRALSHHVVITSVVSTVLVVAAILPAAAAAKLSELGALTDGARGSCPDSCQALTRTTGYQAKVGPDRDLYQAPANGRIVAWTIALGKPGPKQTAFFEERYGGTSQAAVVVLDPGAKLLRTVKAKAPLQKLTDYFGQTVQFPLSRAHAHPQGAVHRPHRADVGADAADRPRLGHVVALEPRAGRLPRRHDPVRAARGPDVGDVPLPVPDGAADLQRDVHPRSEAQPEAR